MVAVATTVLAGEELGLKAALLAPPPDFRYVGLEAGARLRVGFVAGMLGASATFGAGLVTTFGERGLLMTAIAAGGTAYFLRGAFGPRTRGGSSGVPMAIVPWGVLIEPDTQHHVLRWSAVDDLKVEMIHASDQGAITALWSVVTISALGKRLFGRARGAVPLERLAAHLTRYADESSHAVALDLQGESRTDGPLEPEVLPLLAAARDYIQGAPGSSRLDLPPAGYRSTASRAPSARAVAELGEVLRDRRPRDPDPRAFAAVVAAEIHADALLPELLELVQCPHPVVAAVSKAAARKLGAPTSRAGALDEVAPFLQPADVSQLAAWVDGG